MNTPSWVEPDLLASVVASARRIVRSRAELKPIASLERDARGKVSRPGVFRRALERSGQYNVIAECKRRSPKKGLLRADFDPARLARELVDHGAAAVSVVTEPTFFDGSLEHLQAVREAVSLPVLRKDFIVDPYQLFEAKAAGADAILLIAAALEGPSLGEMLRRAVALGLDVIVEVHERIELQRALDDGAPMVGINCRDLRTLQVDPEVCHDLIAAVPNQVLAVAESGIRSGKELAELHAMGYRGFLIGERLMSSPNPGQALGSLIREAGPAPVERGDPER